jgi:hypothetical protein
MFFKFLRKTAAFAAVVTVICAVLLAGCGDSDDENVDNSSPPAASSVSGVTISPSSENITPGGAKVFTATVRGGSNSAVNWEFTPLSGTPVGTTKWIGNGNQATVVIDLNQPIGNTFQLTAMSVEDPNKKTNAIITVTAAGSANPPVLEVIEGSAINKKAFAGTGSPETKITVRNTTPGAAYVQITPVITGQQTGMRIEPNPAYLTSANPSCEISIKWPDNLQAGTVHYNTLSILNDSGGAPVNVDLNLSMVALSQLHIDPPLNRDNWTFEVGQLTPKALLGRFRVWMEDNASPPYREEIIFNESNIEDYVTITYPAESASSSTPTQKRGGTAQAEVTYPPNGQNAKSAKIHTNIKVRSLNERIKAATVSLGTNTIPLYGDEEITAALPAFNASTPITLVSDNGTSRNITSFTSNGALVTTLGPQQKLILGNGVKLEGKSGQTASTTSLITVNDGGELVMEDGSAITAHTTSGNAAGAIKVNGGGTFTMNGGGIRGNKNTMNTTTTAPQAGGLYAAANSKINLNGGTITGNTWEYATSPTKSMGADVLSLNSSSGFNLKGTNIGELWLSGGAKVTLTSSYTGSVQKLNLYYNAGKKPDTGLGVISRWLSVVIIQGYNYSVTSADITKFGLGVFMSNDSSGPTTVSIGGNSLVTSNEWKDGGSKGFRIDSGAGTVGMLYRIP